MSTRPSDPTSGADTLVDGAGDYPALAEVDPAHYVVGAELARGGMGRVRLARDRRLGRVVALKQLILDGEPLRARFEREARITARLQHPGIVPVYEAGRLASGEPFFAMKLVQGRSLDALLREPLVPAERLALVPRVIQVVEAIAYAHARGVIHRDLKPHNVLCGDYGETVVIDWGLAKDLHGEGGETPPMPEPAGVAAAATSGEHHTAAGEVIGTPAYMPPEQAAGESVDERADVYALGALLYHVLAGAPPYTGSDARDVVADVIDGPPVPLEERQPGLPPDLCAIVARAMARDRAARYRDAGELAEELRRFQTGQLVAAHHYRPRELVARWVQKNRAAVLVAVVAFLALTATGGVAVRRVVRERDAAQAARADAEAQRAAADGARLQAEAARDAAEDLVAFMTSTLRDRLAPVGRLDVLAGLGDAVLAYYDKLGVTEGSSDPRALQRRASALSILANVAFDAGRLDEAQAAWRRGLAMREELVAREGRAEQRAELVETLSYLGQVELARGEVQAASEAYQSCLRRVEELAPGDARDRWSVACRMGLGDVALELGRADEALARYTEALTDTRKHLPGAADAFWRRRLAMLLDRLGNAQRARGDLAAALSAFQELLDVTRALAEESPDDTGRLEDLAAAWSKLGEVRADLGDAAGALAAYREDLAISRRLVAHDGDNAEWRHGLTVSLLNVADALVDERPGEAEPLYQECLEVVGGLRARDARRATFRAQEAECRRGLGHVALARGQASAALPHLRTALALTQELVAAEPESFRYQGALVLRWLDLGEAHAAAGKGKDARASYREGLAVAEALLARDPKNPEFVMLRDHMRDKAR